MEQEKTSRDKQIDALNEDISRNEESIVKLNKEKKGLNENLEERTEQLQAAEDKCSSLNKAKNKVEGQLKDVSGLNSYCNIEFDLFEFLSLPPDQRI